LKIEYLKAKNFLCIGDDPLEIDFTKLGNVVLIEGRNTDYHDDAEDYSGSSGDAYHSNGSGKSTLSEALVYGLYGNTIRKKVTHTDAINNINKKKLEVEIIFKIANTRYRIVRSRKPDTIRLWQDGPPWSDDNEITRGGQPTTQKQIEELLGMNHKAFVNVVCYGQHNDYNFLECSAAEQRQIAESLLSLEVFKDFCAQAKDDVKDIRGELRECMAVYKQITKSEIAIQERIEQINQKKAQWKTDCLADIAAAKEAYKNTQAELALSDIGPALLKYEQAQQKISQLNEGLPAKHDKEKSLSHALEQAKGHHDKVREKIHELTLALRSAEQELVDFAKERKKQNAELVKLNNLEQGAECPYCFGVIDKKHYSHVIQLHQNKIKSLEPKINAIKARIEANSIEVKKYEKSLETLTNLRDVAQHKLRKIVADIENTHSEINDLSKTQKPDLSSRELVLEEKLSQAKEKIQAKEQELAGGGPFIEILDVAEADLANVRSQKESQKSKIDELDDLLPYYNWWTKGFDDIRSFIIERIVPSLNARIATWMQYLIGGKIKVTFDKHLDAKIESPDGDQYAYFATCGGERKRINLAISQAFAYVMMLSSGTWPSVVFLDEVSDSIDQRGIRSIYNMICELASEKQVFVITHNIHLRQMLDGVDTITLLREKGFTRRIR